MQCKESGVSFDMHGQRKLCLYSITHSMGH